MSATGYRILGFAVWNGGKWYLRRRLPSSRALVLSTLTAATALGGAAVLPSGSPAEAPGGIARDVRRRP